MTTLIEEYYCDGKKEKISMLIEENDSKASQSSQYRLIKFNSKGNKKIWRSFRHAFLPEDFPSSVTGDYISFQIWDSLQGLSTYIRSMLSTKVLLEGFGVGEMNATAINATFQWFFRDFCGMLGGILFTIFKGSNLDADAKKWRLRADIINDIGMILDLISPLFPSFFLFFLCLGSISRSITGVASGATRAALTQHFAKRQNAADISAKEGSQETLMTMIGICLGLILTKIIHHNFFLLWTCFLSLTLFHVYANYRAVSSLCLNTLNKERLFILFQNFENKHKILSPYEVSKFENIFPFSKLFASILNRIFKKKYNKNKLNKNESNIKESNKKELNINESNKNEWNENVFKIIFGSRLSNLNLAKESDFQNIALRHREKNYFLLVSKDERVVHVFLHKEAMEATFLEAYVHSLQLSKLLSRNETSHSNMDALYFNAQHWMNHNFPAFLQSLQNSKFWNMERFLLDAGNFRLEWKSFEKK